MERLERGKGRGKVSMILGHAAPSTGDHIRVEVKECWVSRQELRAQRGCVSSSGRRGKPRAQGLRPRRSEDVRCKNKQNESL